MNYRRLGNSNLRVSPLCLGTMMFGEQTPDDEAARIVASAREQGVNFIDTADVYNDGRSEQVLGRLLKGQRHDWVLASKIGNAMGQGPNQAHYSRQWLVRGVEASLARLDTDFLDILYLHRDYHEENLEEAVWALGDLIRAGKLRGFGLSNFRGWRIAEVIRLCAQLGVPQPVVCQPYYNMLNRGPEVEILPACGHYGLGVVPYSPIARGVLTGKYLPGQAQGDARAPVVATAASWPPSSARNRCGSRSGWSSMPPRAGAARPLRHRLGAGQSAGQLGDRRPAHAGADAGLLRRAGPAHHARGRDAGGRLGHAGSRFHPRLQRSQLSVPRPAGPRI